MLGMQYDPFEYEMPWRPNYELRCALVWFATALIYLFWAAIGFFSAGVMLWFAAIMLAFGFYYLRPGLLLWEKQGRLVGAPPSFITLKAFRELLGDPAHRNDLWIGEGFEWSVSEIQALTQLNARDEKELITMAVADRKRRIALDLIKRKDTWLHPKQALKHYALKVAEAKREMGSPWIHGVGEDNVNQWMPLNHADGHTLIFGTTGAGKTRFFDLLISQAILRGEPVIIIDPKGDEGMEKNAREACKALNREDAFVYFHIGHPEKSVHLNPLSNWASADEIASRISALLPQDSGSAPFTGFSWLAVNTIAQALILCNISPTLTGLKQYLEGNMEQLVVKTMTAWFKQQMGQEKADRVMRQVLGHIPATSSKGVAALIDFYRVKMTDKQSDVINSLLSMYEHDSAHFSKMITSLMPIIHQVATSHLKELLSPSEEAQSDKVLFRDMQELIANRCVVYIGLDTMSNASVGAAVGSLILADLTAVAGSGYKFGKSQVPSPGNAVEDFRESRLPKFDHSTHVNVFVDEANEVANNPFIQLLNKGRGANFRLFVATQTFSDFVTRLGSRDKAFQVFGNLNNLSALRSIDPETQKFICGRMPKTKIKEVQRDQGQNTLINQPILTGDSFRESLKSVEVELVPSAYLGKLPNLEFWGVISGGHVIKGRVPILLRKEGSEK